MNGQRICAMTKRYFQEYKNDWTRLTNIIYWPLLEVLIMGYTATWLSDSKGLLVILVAAILWQVVVRANYDIMENLLLEVRELNITNLFSSPLMLSEWIISNIIMGIFIQGICLVGGALMMHIFYNLNICTLGIPMIAITANLMIAGWAMALFSCGFIIRDGEKATKFVYMLGWGFALLSGVYFSINVLPPLFAYVARLFPLIYAFNLMRAYLIEGIFSWHDWAINLAMQVAYFCAACYFFYSMFNKSRNRGLSQLLN